MLKRITAGLIVATLIVVAGIISHSLPVRAGLSQQQTWGGTSTCSGNAQTLNLPNIGSMNDLLNVTIGWKVGSGCTNAGPETVSVNGALSQVNIYRVNNGAAIQLGGSEMPAGALVQATWDGTEFILGTDYTNGGTVGHSQIIHSTTPDAGYLLENGACFMSATHPALAAYLGTTYNSQDGCTTGQTGLPDMRGRVPAGADNIGGSAANRLTIFSATAIGNTGGTQGYTSGIAQGYLQNFTLPSSVSINDPGHSHLYNEFLFGGSGESLASGAFGFGIPGAQTGSSNTNITAPSNVTSGGSGSSFPTYPLSQIVNYEIKL